MNAIKKEANELPEDIELLLPWHAAGTLSRRDAARVEQALANDNELAARYELVREELGESIRLNENLGAPSARVMESLFAKIDAEPKREPKSTFQLGAWLTELFASFSPRTLAYGAAGAAFAIVLQAGILAGVFVKQGTGEGSPQILASTKTSDADGSYVNIRFKPEASVADITRLLSSNKAIIVESPKATDGFFKVRVAEQKLTDDEMRTVTRTLRDSQAVDFVASIRQ
jgi:anti-sigma-K factor RskA